MKKILILGGKPIGSCEITEAVNNMGYYSIVADYLSVEKSAAKRISNDHWEISTAEVDELKKKCIDEGVSAVLTGVHEFNIERKIELNEMLGFSQYCNMEQWNFCENKKKFKELCTQHGIDVAKTFNSDNAKFPVIVKPTDSSGSRGFSICHNVEELAKGIELALSFSESKSILIEEFVDCEACIVHYTAVNGKIYFSGMSDKHSQILRGGSSVMALQTFPSKSIDRYIENVNDKAIKMFEDLGVQNGPIWIEVFNDEKTGRFVFNEMGYRFGGSLTNYPVKHFYEIDQLDLMIKNAVGEIADETAISVDFKPSTNNYCILPIHLLPGKMKSVTKIADIEAIDGVVKLVQVHFEGDEIQEWGTAQQVFCYLHVAYNTADELKDCLSKVKSALSVKSDAGEEMIYYLFDLKKLGVE